MGTAFRTSCHMLNLIQRLMLESFRKKAEKAISEGLISASERKEIMQAYDNGLRGYTYYER